MRGESTGAPYAAGSLRRVRVGSVFTSVIWFAQRVRFDFVELVYRS